MIISLINTNDIIQQHNIQNFITFSNVLLVSFSLYSITTFQYFTMLFEYIINFSYHSKLISLSCNSFLIFFLFWLTIAVAFCFFSLHSLQKLSLFSFQHNKHFIFIPRYYVNNHKEFSPYLNLNFYVIRSIVIQLSNSYLYSRKL